jgi:GST-like protein
MMLDLYFWTTPNGYKPLIFIYEAEQEFTPHLINIREQQQFTPEFLAISPNNKIPALVDHSPNQGQQPIVLFESGAILLYLAEKFEMGLGNGILDRAAVMKWLFWQVAGLGHMSGQYHHFTVFADEQVPYLCY